MSVAHFSWGQTPEKHQDTIRHELSQQLKMMEDKVRDLEKEDAFLKERLRQRAHDTERHVTGSTARLVSSRTSAENESRAFGEQKARACDSPQKGVVSNIRYIEEIDTSSTVAIT